MKQTKELFQAIVNLRGNADFKVFMEAIKEQGITATHMALRAEGAPCHRAQGEALFCETLIGIVKSAPDTLQKFIK